VVVGRGVAEQSIRWRILKELAGFVPLAVCDVAEQSIRWRILKELTRRPGTLRAMPGHHTDKEPKP